MSGNFFSCSKGVKDPSEVQEGRCDLPRDASEEKGLISPGGVKTLLGFLELQQVPLEFGRGPQGPLWWPQVIPITERVTRGPLGIPLPSMPGPKTLCGVSDGT